MNAINLAAETLRPAIAAATSRAVANAATGMDQGDAADVAHAVTREVAAVVVNQTNQEPWYQSRVTIGAIVSIAVPVLGALGVSADIVDADQLTALLVAAGTVAGGILTLYGRWKARKPLGS